MPHCLLPGAHFTADWAYQSPPSEQIVQMLRPGGRRVILFHILRTSGASMAEIASAIGYGSEASFSRAFKRHAGISPSEWRARGSDGPAALIA